MLESLLAAIGALICIALLVHMFLPRVLRGRVDRLAGSFWQLLRALPRAFRPPRPVRRPAAVQASAPRKPQPAAEKPQAVLDLEAERQAEQEAHDIIERARRQARNAASVERDGNVLRPDAFKPRPPKDKLH